MIRYARLWISLKFRYSLLAVLMAFMLMLAGCGSQGGTSGGAGAQKPDGVTVKMLDVGQGDAILVRTSEQTILIDTSDVDEQAKLKAALEKENVKTIDKLILTHPHADHIGGVQTVFKMCEVKAVYDNGEPTTSKLYRGYLKTIKQKGIEYKHLHDGDVLEFGGGVTFTVMSPTEDMVKNGGKKNGKTNLNLNSIVGRLKCGEFTMLFTGDAEKETEEALLKRHSAAELKSLVLKSPHHGSKTSSSNKFLKAVAPEQVVISCGKDNDYGHPHTETVKRYEKLNIKRWVTKDNGTITIKSDGKTYDVSSER